MLTQTDHSPLRRLGLDSILVRYAPALEHVLAEPTAPVLAELIKKGGYTHFAGPHSALGKNIFPRVAGLLEVQQVRDNRHLGTISPPGEISISTGSSG